MHDPNEASIKGTARSLTAVQLMVGIAVLVVGLVWFAVTFGPLFAEGG